jgi:zinc and cadmium transporter
MSASTCVLGASAVYIATGTAPGALPYVLAFAAGSFLYVAMSDLIPGLHREAVDVGAVRQVVMIGLGVGTIVLL